MLVRAHPERALDMRREDTVSETKPSAALQGKGQGRGGGGPLGTIPPASMQAAHEKGVAIYSTTREIERRSFR